jgi:hypothetical protein
MTEVGRQEPHEMVQTGPCHPAVGTNGSTDAVDPKATAPNVSFRVTNFNQSSKALPYASHESVRRGGSVSKRNGSGGVICRKWIGVSLKVLADVRLRVIP